MVKLPKLNGVGSIPITRSNPFAASIEPTRLVTPVSEPGEHGHAFEDCSVQNQNPKGRLVQQRMGPPRQGGPSLVWQP